MIRKKTLYGSSGLRLLRLPVGKDNSIDTAGKNIADLDRTTAANMLSVTGVKANAPMIMCGKYNKLYPVLKQLLRMSPTSYVLVGTKKDLEDSCFTHISTDWRENQLTSNNLPDGNGMIVLRPGTETIYMMKEVVPNWYDHFVVLCLGNGLQVDLELLHILNCLGKYIIVTESLGRSIRGSEEGKITAEEVLVSMDYIVISAIGTSAKSLMSVLPSYECEKITNTVDFSFHRDSPDNVSGNIHHRNGGGLQVGQARTQETKCIVTQDDLIKMQDNNTMLIYNARVSHTWVARIAR
ncbi:MAG: hypothetical protein Q4E24_01305 [bacterium]|nr:hypothetical protein [bacterium]